MAKKIIKGIPKCLCVIAALILCFYVGIGLFGGFHMKGIACQGGFITSFYQQQTENGNIQKICGETLSEDQLMQIKNNLHIDKDKDRIMHTKYISENGKEINLQCKINWFWNDVYVWTKES